MLIAMFADIHANRQAFSACLAQAGELGAARAAQCVLLGDLVGYGADPEWTVATAMKLVAEGAFAVRGNHDNAVGDPAESMNAEAKIAIDWTRNELGRDERRFLSELPLTREDGDRLYVHADASKPQGWRYVTSAAEAADSMIATQLALTFCGHVHRPMLYTMSATGKVTAFQPTADTPIPLLGGGRRWLAVLGSVGQPRDRNPAAAYATFDTERRELTFRRAPYDVAAAADAIRGKGLPAFFADRLQQGI